MKKKKRNEESAKEKGVQKCWKRISEREKKKERNENSNLRED